MTIYISIVLNNFRWFWFRRVPRSHGLSTMYEGLQTLTSKTVDWRAVAHQAAARVGFKTGWHGKSFVFNGGSYPKNGPPPVD